MGLLVRAVSSLRARHAFLPAAMAAHTCCQQQAAAGFEVVIALGSNQTDRVQQLRRAVQQLPHVGVNVVRTSGLFETSPAYVTDQPRFLNAALLARTTLPPRELLAALKSLEQGAGRDLASGPRYGPRPLDLDIIFYGNVKYSDDALSIPHPRWQERPFVKAPLADLLYESDLQHASPFWRSSSSSSRRRRQMQHLEEEELQQLQQQQQQQEEASPSRSQETDDMFYNPARHDSRVAPAAERACRSGSGDGCTTSSPPSAAAPGAMDNTRAMQPLILAKQTWCAEGGESLVGSADLRRVTALGPNGSLVSWGSRTWLMGICNVTPDSFSDGGLAATTEQAVVHAKQLVAQGADIIDIGGQSTRPGAARLSAQEELARVMPVIRALREDPATSGALLSVDTFYSQVAADAVAAGANIVNDVSGGGLDDAMLPTVASLGVPYVLMHMRGDPTTMQSAQNTSYAGTGGVWHGVAEELQAAAARAMSAGIPAWDIILDPGIGFAKTADGNVELLRHLRDMRALGGLQGPFAAGPMLVGPSRKGFLGRLTGRKRPDERDAATVAASVACVVGGADIVRAHNVAAVWDGLRVADAVFRI